MERVPRSLLGRNHKCTSRLERKENFVGWVEAHSGPKAFAARPVLFDGAWMDHYLRTFADRSVFEVSMWHKPLFDRAALDIESYAHGVFGRRTTNEAGVGPPTELTGSFEHTHHAIDDALGYASYLSHLLREPPRRP